MTQPGIHETNVRLGLESPLPDFLQVIDDAKYWGVSPMEIQEWPMEWVTNGRIMRKAERLAREAQERR